MLKNYIAKVSILMTFIFSGLDAGESLASNDEKEVVYTRIKSLVSRTVEEANKKLAEISDPDIDFSYIPARYPGQTPINVRAQIIQYQKILDELALIMKNLPSTAGANTQVDAYKFLFKLTDLIKLDVSGPIEKNWLYASCYRYLGMNLELIWPSERLEWPSMEWKKP